MTKHILALFAVIGAVYGGIFALDQRFVPHAYAMNMVRQIQAVTKRLDRKIHEDKIFYAERERWEAIKRYGQKSIEVQKVEAKIEKLKRTAPK